MSESVEITVTSDRGFHAYGTPMETDYGHTVTVRESSSAEGPHVWLFADGSVKVAPESHDPHYDNSLGGKHVYREGHVGIHLDREQAVGLIARLQAWVDEIPQRWETSEDDEL